MSLCWESYIWEKYKHAEYILIDFLFSWHHSNNLLLQLCIAQNINMLSFSPAKAHIPQLPCGSKTTWICCHCLLSEARTFWVGTSWLSIVLCFSMWPCMLNPGDNLAIHTALLWRPCRSFCTNIDLLEQSNPYMSRPGIWKGWSKDLCGSLIFSVRQPASQSA